MYKIIARICFLLGVAAIWLAFYGWAFFDIWLASAQWIQVAAVLMLMAIFIKMNEDEEQHFDFKRKRSSLVEKLKNHKKEKQEKKEAKKQVKKHVSFKLTQ